MKSHTQLLLLDESIDPNAAVKFVTSNNYQAVTSFIKKSEVHHLNLKGLTPLEFEARATIAQSELAQILHEVLEEFNIHRVALHFHLGLVQIDDISICIAVAAEYLEDSSRACQFIMNKIDGHDNWQFIIAENKSIWTKNNPS